MQEFTRLRKRPLRMLSRLRHWSHHALARLPTALPSACALCGGPSGLLCDACRARYAERGRHRCIGCALPLPAHAVPEQTRCGNCLRAPPAFDATVAAVDYQPPLDQLVLALKFGGRLELAPLLADMMRDALLASGPGELPACLTAAPLGPRRLIERGFNQALEIARPLSRALGVALDAQLLKRERDTQPQSLLHPDERRRNIRHAFVVPGEAIERVRGRHIGVVDEVMTTGETLDEIAATLKRFGASRVTNFVFARTAR
jgi:ComF family protein